MRRGQKVQLLLALALGLALHGERFTHEDPLTPSQKRALHPPIPRSTTRLGVTDSEAGGQACGRREQEARSLPPPRRRPVSQPMRPFTSSRATHETLLPSPAQQTLQLQLNMTLTQPQSPSQASPRGRPETRPPPGSTARRAARPCAGSSFREAACPRLTKWSSWEERRPAAVLVSVADPCCPPHV